MKTDLTVVILTKNEEMHILRCLNSVRDIARRIVIVDSFSTDKTLELASSFDAEVAVYQHPFKNQADQFQWAMGNTDIDTEWVMRLDADEIIESDLVSEIKDKLPKLPANIVGINLKRKHIFMDCWVKYGGRYPLIMLRIWRNGHGQMEDRWMDEHMTVTGGRTVTFNGGFADHNLNDLTFFTEKHNSYATREAIEILNQKYDLFRRDDEISKLNTSVQVALKRFIKERIYNYIPFTFSALLYFIWRYIFQLGFLDGRSGLVYHFLQGFWYRFLVGSKVMEYEQAIAHLSNKQQIIEELSKLTGHKLLNVANKEQ